MEKKLEPLTQQGLSKISFHQRDEWVVVVNKKSHSLNGKQTEILKKATESNFRGIIWFEKFAISIPHIQEIYRSKSGKAVVEEEKFTNNMLKGAKDAPSKSDAERLKSLVNG